MNDDFLSSDMPMPSSPPKNGGLDIGFQLYEDPSTSTTGLWGGTSMFESDPILGSFDNGVKMEMNDMPESSTLLKMQVGGVTVDFAAMIEEVVANNVTDSHDQESTSAQSPETQSSNIARTPEVPVGE
jgi:hypothetical protein